MHEQSAEIRSILGERGRAALRLTLTEAVQRQSSRLARATSANEDIDFSTFQIGSVVWLRTKAAPRDGRKKKYTLGNSGPYWITEVHGPLSYVVEHVRTGASLRAHHFRLSLASAKQQATYSRVQATSPTPATLTPTTSTNISPEPQHGSPSPASHHSRYVQRISRRKPARFVTIISDVHAPEDV